MCFLSCSSSPVCVGGFENNSVLFIWWFHRRWWGLSPPSAAVCTLTLALLSFSVHSIYARPACSPSVIPDCSLWWQSSLCSTTSVSQECHFSIYAGFVWFWGHSGTFFSSLTPCLFFHLRLFISSHSSPPPLYLSRRGFHKVADVKSKRKQNGAER